MKKIVVAAVAAVASSGAAIAADVAMKQKVVAVVPPPPAWDVAFGAALSNNYMFRGISQSNRKASVSGYFEPRYKVGDWEFYTGIAGASIDFPNRAAAEIDFYAGVRPTFGKFVFDLGWFYYYYPGGRCFNPLIPGECAANGALPINGNVMKGDVSFYELYGKVTYNWTEQFSLGGVVFWSPNFLQTGADGTYASAMAKYVFPTFANGVGTYVSGEFGRQWFGTSDSFYGTVLFPNGIAYADYNTWNVGIGFTYKVFTLDLRYIDTNLSKGDCNAFTSDHTAPLNNNFTVINPSGAGSRWCSAAFVAKLSADLTLNTNIK